MSELCLVTGGAGFIGSHLVEALTAQGRTVRVLDNLSTGRRENLAHIRPAPEIAEADLTDAAAVARAMAGVGVAFHLGALASVQASVANPVLSHHTCATGSLHVVDAARQSRDFTYGADAVQAVVRAAGASGVAGQVYNGGRGRSVSVLDLIATLNRLLGTNVIPKHGPARAGDIRHSRADISRARRDLGYEPGISFEDGLERTLRWYRESGLAR